MWVLAAAGVVAGAGFAQAGGPASPRGAAATDPVGSASPGVGAVTDPVGSASPGVGAVTVPVGSAPVDTADTVANGAPLVGTQPFTNHRNPPSYRPLSAAEFARYDLGQMVFNTQFVTAGTPNAGRRDGIGPLFNAASCDQCHNNGARGRGPSEDGPAQAPLVIQLSTPQTNDTIDPAGDPVYGRVFNTLSLDGVPDEGVAMIRYESASGHYPDGASWTLRVPHYTLTNLHYGPLAPHTIVKPRLAPALFGVGLLEAIEDESSARADGDGKRLVTVHARFGWQASATSVRDQTARAFAREMGLTTSDIPRDDCTPAETDCQHQPNGGTPEVSAELMDAVLSFQHWLAVPASPQPHLPTDSAGKLFVDIGCSGCHRPRSPVTLTDADGKPYAATIAPYTDLQRHDLGPRLADESVSGRKIPSRWRTAPLWGLGYRLSFERYPTFLHDGRARSVEEAILWHDGEAATARLRFERLTAGERAELVRWVGTL